jgi:DNA-binding MarR family transcriptional regulator
MPQQAPPQPPITRTATAYPQNHRLRPVAVNQLPPAVAASGTPKPARAAVLTQAVRTANHVRTRLEKAVLRDAGLSWTAYDVLSLACQVTDIETRQVTAVMGIAKSTLTLAMTTLTERHLVQRCAQPDDKRRVVLRPTPAGLELARRLAAGINAEQDRVLAELGITEPDRLTRALRALGKHCQSDTDTGPARQHHL